jgi:hypothetical protein
VAVPLTGRGGLLDTSPMPGAQLLSAAGLLALVLTAASLSRTARRRSE